MPTVAGLIKTMIPIKNADIHYMGKSLSCIYANINEQTSETLEYIGRGQTGQIIPDTLRYELDDKTVLFLKTRSL